MHVYTVRWSAERFVLNTNGIRYSYNVENKISLFAAQLVKNYIIQEDSIVFTVYEVSYSRVYRGYQSQTTVQQ